MAVWPHCEQVAQNRKLNTTQSTALIPAKGKPPSYFAFFKSVYPCIQWPVNKCGRVVMTLKVNHPYRFEHWTL